MVRCGADNPAAHFFAIGGRENGRRDGLTGKDWIEKRKFVRIFLKD